MATNDLFFLHGAHTRRCSAVLDKHFVGYHSLQLLTAGAVELFYGDERYHIAQPSWWPGFPGPRVRFHAADGHRWWEHRYVAFRGPLVKQWQAAGLLLRAPQPAVDPAEGAARFDELYRLLKRTDTIAHRSAVNLLERMLIDLAEHRRTATTEPAWIQRIRLKLQQNTSFDVDYQQLADELGMGLSTLRRRFRDTTGMTLHDAVMQQRAAEAQQLLVETDMPIKQIAHDLRYRDVFYFARQFRRLTGVPPATYRRSRQR